MTRLSKSVTVLLVLVALVAAACGDDDDAVVADSTTTPGDTGSATTAASTPSTGDGTTPASDATSTTTVAATATVGIYFVRDERLAVSYQAVEGAPAVGRAAVEALLAGPTSDEQAQGMGTEIPAGTTLLDLDIADGVATVDLSGSFDDGGGSASMQLRLAQLVYTLTGFDTVQSVRLLLDGEAVDAIGGEGVIVAPPRTRADLAEFRPFIEVATPLPGAEVSSPVHVTGENNTFESTVQVRVVDGDGNVLGEGFGTGSGGMGNWGPYVVDVDIETGGAISGYVEVYESSAEDGSVINQVRVPVTFAA